MIRSRDAMLSIWEGLPGAHPRLMDDAHGSATPERPAARPMARPTARPTARPLTAAYVSCYPERGGEP